LAEAVKFTALFMQSTNGDSKETLIFDWFLGQMAVKGETREEYHVAARKMYMQILDMPNDPLPIDQASPKRNSLRRRFLNWLERG
jgi:hypothetical protein